MVPVGNKSHEKNTKKNKTQNLQLRVAHRAKILVQQRFIVLMMGTNYLFIYLFFFNLHFGDMPCVTANADRKQQFAGVNPTNTAPRL